MSAKTIDIKSYDNIVPCPVIYNLETCEKRFDKLVKSIGHDPREYGFTHKGDACTHIFGSEKNDTLAIVTIRPDRDQKIETVFAMIAHEAVHVWQHICEELNEESPSSEFEAYSIQAICANLFSEYTKQTKDFHNG